MCHNNSLTSKAYYSVKAAEKKIVNKPMAEMDGHSNI